MFAVPNGGHTSAQLQYNLSMGMVPGTPDLCGYSPFTGIIHATELKAPGSEHVRTKIINQLQKVEMMNTAGGHALMTEREEIAVKFWDACLSGDSETCRRLAIVENARMRELLKGSKSKVKFVY
jgi:hypothetical protein